MGLAFAGHGSVLLGADHPVLGALGVCLRNLNVSLSERKETDHVSVDWNMSLEKLPAP